MKVNESILNQGENNNYNCYCCAYKMSLFVMHASACDHRIGFNMNTLYIYKRIHTKQPYAYRFVHVLIKSFGFLSPQCFFCNLISPDCLFEQSEWGYRG